MLATLAPRREWGSKVTGGWQGRGFTRPAPECNEGKVGDTPDSPRKAGCLDCARGDCPLAYHLRNYWLRCSTLRTVAGCQLPPLAVWMFRASSSAAMVA